MVLIEKETPDQPGIRCLLELADARSAALYPKESRFGWGLAELLSQDVRFYVARQHQCVVGCGGYAIGPVGHAELKRLFVLPEARGSGIGRRIVLALEAAAADEQIRCIRLETGIRSDEAIRLYRRLGYGERGPFEPYRPDPLSVFMEKMLDGT